MARYSTDDRLALAPAEAFAYMADFSNARFWDPSVSQARREDDGPVGLGSELPRSVARFAGRDVAADLRDRRVRAAGEGRARGAARLRLARHDHRRGRGGGSLVHYDAVLAFSGIALSSIRSCSSTTRVMPLNARP